jgi:L-malate glycosyltransferase
MAMAVRKKAAKMKRKILIVNYEYPPLGGGGGVATHDLALEWSRNNEVHVLTSAFKDTPLYEKMGKIHVHRVRVWNRNSRDAASFLSMFSYVLFGFFKGFRLARANRFSVMNTHFAVPSGPLGWALGLLFGIPNVLSLHGGDIYDPSKKSSPHRSFLFKRVVKFILNRAQRIVAQSSNTRDNTVKYYNPRREVEIIPLAFHPPKISPGGFRLPDARRGDFTMVTIGRLVKRKSVETILQAMAIQGDSRVRLYILGDGPEQDMLQKRAEYLNIADRVYFAGFVTEKQKYDYLTSCSAYIMTSLHEGFGIVFMEAMFCGLPIICTNHGGQTDFLKDGVNALLLNVGDHAVCAASIDRLMKDKKLYKKLATANRRDVRVFYAEQVAARYERIFDELTGV